MKKHRDNFNFYMAVLSTDRSIYHNGRVKKSYRMFSVETL